jgi:hypothetical protein
VSFIFQGSSFFQWIFTEKFLSLIDDDAVSSSNGNDARIIGINGTKTASPCGYFDPWFFPGAWANAEAEA